MSLFSNLLRDQEKLFRLSILFSIIPLSLSLIDELVYPIFLGLLSSILLLNHRGIRNSYLELKRMDPIVRMSALFGLFAFFFLIWVIWFGFNIQPNFIINTVLAIILYLSWNSIILAKLDTFPFRPIFRGEVDSFDFTRDFSSTIIPVTISTFFAAVIILIDSLVQSQSQELIAVESLYWVAFPILVLFHSILHELFIQEVDWHPISGITTYKLHKPVVPPQSLDAKAITEYFHQIEQTPFHEEFFEFLDKNLPKLVKNFRTLYYTAALHSIVRIYSYWGEKTVKHLHYLHLFVAASLSRFRVLGIIPLYNRFMFYSYLELLFKLQVLPDDWIGIIRYEIEEQKDEYHRLDWIVNIPYVPEVHGNLKWLSLWNEKIYRGEAGYVKLADDIVHNNLFVINDLEGWKVDVWEMIYSYLLIFVGPEAREAFQGKLSLDDALDFLAEKKRLVDFQADVDRRKKDLEDPENRMVHTHMEETDKSVSARQLLSYLDTDSYASDEPESIPISNRIKYAIFQGRGTAFKLVIMLAILAVNVLILHGIASIFGRNIMQIVMVIEMLVTQIFSVSPVGGIMNQDRARENADVQSNRQFGNKSMDPGNARGTGESLIYTILLAFAYFLFLS